MSKHILVVGSINVDYVIHTDRLPKLGETITGSGFAMNFGGKGANQAVAIAKAGCETKILGAVGNDLAGRLALENLNKYGVNTDNVLKVDAPTGAAVITVCDGDNHIILDVGANAYVTPSVVQENHALFEWADIVVMQYEIPTESVFTAAKLVHSLEKIVVLNPAPVKEVNVELYNYIDLLIPNEFEAGLITGITVDSSEAAHTALERLMELGCKNAIITLGKHGCAYKADGDTRFAGIYDVKRVDTTAAGDSFIGGMCTKFCDGADMDSAIEYASAVSSITVSRSGAAVSIPTSDEVEKFLHVHKISEFERY